MHRSFIMPDGKSRNRPVRNQNPERTNQSEICAWSTLPGGPLSPPPPAIPSRQGSSPATLPSLTIRAPRGFPLPAMPRGFPGDFTDRATSTATRDGAGYDGCESISAAPLRVFRWRRRQRSRQRWQQTATISPASAPASAPSPLPSERDERSEDRGEVRAYFRGSGLFPSPHRGGCGACSGYVGICERSNW